MVVIEDEQSCILAVGPYPHQRSNNKTQAGKSRKASKSYLINPPFVPSKSRLPANLDKAVSVYSFGS